MFKSVHIAVILFVWAFAINAQTMEFRKISWEEAKASAHKEKKGIFVDVYTSWCVPCKKMEAVFADSAVAAYMSEHFISIRLDAEKESDYALFKLYRPSAYPTFYWFNAQGELSDVKTGYMPADVFIENAENARKNNLSKQYDAYVERWRKGERDYEFVKDFLFDIMPKVYADSVRPYFNLYLQGLSEKELKSRRTCELVRRFTHSITDDAVWRTLVKYNDVYQSYFGYGFGKQMYMNLVRIPMAERFDAEKYARDSACLASIDFPRKEMYREILEMEKRLFNRKYGEALKQAVSLGDRYAGVFPYLYAEMYYTFIIGHFFESNYSPAPEEQKAILALAQKSFDALPSQCTLLYVAAACARNNDYKKAYECMASLPFYGEPVLSSAVYRLLNLERVFPSKQ